MLLEHYSQLNAANIAQDKLHELKQYSAIQDYIAVFDNIIILLPELPEME